ncbi:unnamed protein product (macronuclear) [Paramecium tetraurelia]|uniref:Uncharacterized protein n=1 Tax=Paramecium tetraurelia TaxID=5888 RepID=A0EGV4_PARTE|nr:uncharacterized protein GSPATT00026869001 [Paramecium tetraurelia]CAK94545.1 unnamed protein product [Paramecium tetraurelia]|eukprot:XP_001461918.1 hypothetical protein (macronuclear) [Paramecium tetraurelia strain d4-2]
MFKIPYEEEDVHNYLFDNQSRAISLSKMLSNKPMKLTKFYNSNLKLRRKKLNNKNKKTQIKWQKQHQKEIKEPKRQHHPKATKHVKKVTKKPN